MAHVNGKTDAEVVAEAKSITQMDTWDQMVFATNVINSLAQIDSKAANKEFDRLTTLLANCTVAAQ